MKATTPPKLLLGVAACLSVAYAAESNDITKHPFSDLPLRNLGPAVTGGRISDFAVNPNSPSNYFVATASGGVWKTTNAGVTWKPVFDTQTSYSIGDVELDPNNSNIVWAGTGENNSQRSVSYGDGIYKSVDGGETWKNMGLANSEHIGDILIDPRDSQVVYVAAQGPLWNKGGDRGLYKTVNGGQDWEKVLDVSEHTGVSDLAFDPTNPDIIYATSYQRRRHVWTLINGGPESTIYKTTDAGNTWRKINSGLPSVDLGRIGIAIAPSDSHILYAIVEAAQGKSGFYRSINGGESWQKQSDYISGSPQYYNEIVVDPKNPLRVYSLDTYLMVSDDGGKNFRRAGEANKHVDNHALWIDPLNTEHMLIGSDGGVYETWDRAANWQFKNNMPLTQFYRVTVDNAKPFYNVFGGTQDNASIGAPHRTTTTSGIRNQDWLYTQFGDGFKTVIDPTDSNIIYSQYQYGGLARYDKQSGQRMQIKPVTPSIDEAQRFNWNSPLLISPHDHKRIYYASQRVFRSDNQGQSWQAVSEDLSRNLNRNALPVMDKIWSVDAVAKNQSTSFYGSVVSLTESPVKQGVLFAGTDDGVIQVTVDGGDNWTVAKWPKGVPEYAYVSDLEASLFSDSTIFATFDNHKKGDFKPYVFRSDDHGKKWTNITSNLPVKGSVYTLVQDHQDPQLLFAGTEFGLFFTQNGGQEWKQLKSGLPTIAVRDLEIQRRENDLAIASFGRGFFILDDYTALRTKPKTLESQPATLFPVRRAFQFVSHSPLGLPGKSMQGADYYTANNPEYGAVFTYYINEDVSSLSNKRRDAEKDAAKSNKTIPYPTWEALENEASETPIELLFTITDDQNQVVKKIRTAAKKGLQRINWDLKYPHFGPVSLEGNADGGPHVVPGMYQVSLSKLVNGKEVPYGQSQRFEVEEIDNRTFPSQHRDEDLKFDIKVARLSNAIEGTQQFITALTTRLEYVDKAISQTPNVGSSLHTQVQTLRQTLKEVKFKLEGNAVIRAHSEPVPESIVDMIEFVKWSRRENTSSVTGEQTKRFNFSNQGYQALYPTIKALDESLLALETQLLNQASGYLPGTLPVL